MSLVGVGVFVLASVLTGAFGRRETGSTVDDVMRALGPVFGITLVVSAIAAFVLAIRALVVDRQRTPVVWLSLAYGVFGLIFLLGELLLPH